MLSTVHERTALSSYRSHHSRVSFLLAAAILAVSGCSSTDTIVAVNFNFAMPIAGVTSVVVTITQPGQTPVMASFTPQTTPIDGGVMIKQMYFERITLPESWG